MAGKIFINYRRGDDPSAAQALLSRLEHAFLPEQLFMDVDNIKPGLDFVRVLNDQVAQCDVLISIIGRNWIDARDVHGARRLDDPDDFVRIEIETALQQDKRVIPVLIGQAQMPRPEELPEALRPLARRNAVRLTHERFRSDVQGLIKALQEYLKETEARREPELEAKRRAQAEAEQKQREAEATRRAAEEKRRKVADVKAAERAVAERKRQQAEASRHAQVERAFDRAKRAGTVVALDGFLVTHATSAFVDEARTLRAALLAREGAYRDATESDDPAVIRSFIATYSKGADIDQVRRRLRRLEAQHGWRPSTSLVIPVALALVLTGGAGAYWLAMKRPPPASPKIPPAATMPPIPSKQTMVSPPSPTPDQAAWELLKDTTDPEALRRFLAEYPTSPLRKQAQARLAGLEAAKPPTPVSPRPDELAWQLVKDTTDEAELKRFVSQYPNSPLRKDAEARIAALEAARAAKPPSPPPDEVAWAFLKGTTDEDALKHFIIQYPNSALRKDAEARIAALEAARAAQPKPPSLEEIAWNIVKDSTDPDELRRFIMQFPNSAKRPEAEQKIAKLTAAAAKNASPDSVDPHALALALQFELKRVGCFTGTLNGEFDSDTKAAWHRFTKLASIKVPDDVTPDAIKAVRAIKKRVCPLICRHDEHTEGNNCVTNEPPPKRAARAKLREREQVRPAPARAPAPVSNTGCVMSDREAFNGVSGPPGCRP